MSTPQSGGLKGVVSLSEVKIKYEELSDEQKNLVDCIGAEAFIKLVTCYGGTTLYVPKADSLARSKRDEAIRAEFDGYNYRELCRKYKLSERTIRSITAEKNNRLRNAPLAGQITIDGLEDLKTDC